MKFITASGKVGCAEGPIFEAHLQPFKVQEEKELASFTTKLYISGGGTLPIRHHPHCNFKYGIQITL